MHVHLCSASWRALQAEHVQCIIRFIAAANRAGVPVTYDPVVGDALIERARAIGATRFLRATTADVHLMIDDDIIFRPEDALALCEAAVEHGIVVGVYPTRSATRCFPATTFYEGEPMAFEGQHGLVPVRWGTTGFMAVNRAVIQQLSEREDMPLCHEHDEGSQPFYPFFTPYPYLLNGKWVYLSEDYAFCEHAKEEGFTIYADPGIHLAHLGTYAYELQDMAREPKPRGALKLTLQDDRRFKVEMQQAPAAPSVALVGSDGKPLSRQQRRHAERQEAKVPALAG